MADNIMVIGEAKTLAQLLTNDFSETNGRFEDSTIVKPNRLGFLSNLREVKFPSATDLSVIQFSEDFKLEVVDFGGGTNSPGSIFHKCYALREIILRKTDGVTTLNASPGDTPLVYRPQTVSVYVPRNLISNYQNASTWSTRYASNPNLFKALEDYTVDGTTIGEMNWALIDTLPTPLYSLTEQTFNGTSDYVDTGLQLFSTTSPEFTIICDFEWPQQTQSNAGIFGCSVSGTVGIRARRNSTDKDIATEHSRPGTSSTHHNTITCNYGDRIQIGWYVAGNISSKMVWKNGEYYDHLYNSGTAPSTTMTKTLVVGRNDWDSNIAYYKGIIHNFKVYNKALNGRQIRTVLGID